MAWLEATTRNRLHPDRANTDESGDSPVAHDIQLAEGTRLVHRPMQRVGAAQCQG
jgi:hypothetical protein